MTLKTGRTSRSGRMSMRGAATAADIMSSGVMAVSADMTVRQLVVFLRENEITGRIHRYLVTRDESVVGIVTSLDLLKLLCQEVPGARGGARPTRPRAVLSR